MFQLLTCNDRKFHFAALTDRVLYTHDLIHGDCRNVYYTFIYRYVLCLLYFLVFPVPMPRRTRLTNYINVKNFEFITGIILGMG